MKTINGWTKETMIAHIRDNFKGKSVDTLSRRCLYRGPNETKCAVGIFIPDSLYNIKMETQDNTSAGTVIYDYDLGGVMPLEVSGMTDLQRAHDRSCPDQTLDAMINWVETNVE